jgi:tubby-related protein 1
MHLSEGYTFLLAGKKRANSQTSNYLISMNQDELSTRNPAYLGKLRSNFLGTQFVIYDTGLDPAKKTATPETIREELGVALYESNLLTNKGPRKMRPLLPFVNLQNERLEWKPTRKEESMGERYQAGDTAGMMTFFNKPPKWNDHIQAFVLNFNGRVDRASVKNFQLIDDQDENTVYLQFGRVGDKDFNLDFQWPFSPLQAFAIALSSFDYKIACE